MGHSLNLKTSFTADWPAEETEAANSGETTKHLWEESWDDDDTSDDFSKQLKYVPFYYSLKTKRYSRTDLFWLLQHE